MGMDGLAAWGGPTCMVLLQPRTENWQGINDMTYWLNLYSPETYESFSNSDRSLSGFRYRQRNQAQKIKQGDRFICYMTKLSRWVGVLEVASNVFHDDSPFYYEEDDPFIIRFKVHPVVWLAKEKTVPIHEPRVWNNLSFTRDAEHGSSTWTGKIRSSLNELDEADGRFLEGLLRSQQENGDIYAFDEAQYNRYVTHRVRTVDRVVSVTIPDSEEESEHEVAPASEIRESIQMQAALAELGHRMGLTIWVPRADRSRVEQAMNSGESVPFLDTLPLNYDDTTLKTIEQIDVLWLQRRAIVRAFEVEHTTSVYSGILRMADLLALQPNMDIRLHIVAPETRKDKVFTEIRRPVFSLLDRGPLAESCTYLSYDSVLELNALNHLQHVSHSILDEYAEEAE